MNGVSHANGNMDDWDPLSEHYNDVGSNSYDSGAGSKLPPSLQPGAYRKEEKNVYTLWVKPIPTRYDENSLKNLFADCGEVTDVLILFCEETGNRWAFVEYKTMAAANSAIRKFNDQSKFPFKVQFAHRNIFRKNPRKSTHFTPINKADAADGFSVNDTKPPLFSIPTPVSSFSDRADATVTENYNRRQSLTMQRPPTSLGSTSPTADRSLPVSFAFAQDIFPSEKKPRGNYSRNKSSGFRAPYNETSRKDEGSTYTTLPTCSNPNCKKRTFIKCVSCQKAFCNQECQMDGWKQHTSDDCIRRGLLSNEVPGSSRDCSARLRNNHDGSNNKYYKSDITEVSIKQFAQDVPDYVESTKQYKEVNDDEYPPVTHSNPNEYEDNVQQPDKKEYPEKKNHNDENGLFAQGGRSGAEDRGRSRNHLSQQDHNHRRDYEDENKQVDSRRNGGGGGRGGYGNDETRNGGNDHWTNRQSTNRTSFTDGNADNGRKGGGAYQRKTERSWMEDGGNCDVGYQRKTERSRTEDGNSAEGPQRRNERSPAECQRRNERREEKSAFRKPHQENRRNDFQNKDYNGGRLTLEENVTVAIKISEVSPDGKLCYVTFVDEEELQKNMLQDLNNVKSFEPLETLENVKCVYLLDKIWFRACVLQPKDSINVRLVDSGRIIDNCDAKDIRKLPHPFDKMKLFAHKIILDTDQNTIKSWKADKRNIHITPIEQNHNVWKAKVVSYESSFEEKLAAAKETRDGKVNTVTSAAAKSSPSQQSGKQRSSPAAAMCSNSMSKSPQSSPSRNSVLTQAGELTFKVGISINVYVSYIENETTFYVTNIDFLQKVCTKIKNAKIDSVKDLDKVEKNAMCFRFFSDTWCRAKIIETNPLEVYYIDYGNTETLDNINGLKACPMDLMTLHPSALKVKLLYGTVKENNIVAEDFATIIPYKQDETNTWIVHTNELPTLPDDKSNASFKRVSFSNNVTAVAPQSLSDRTGPTQKAPSSPSTGPSIPTKSAAAVEIEEVIVTHNESKSVYYCIKEEDKSVWNHLTAIKPSEKVIDPILNKVYAVQFDGVWCRGKVTDLDPVKVYFIDYGNVYEADEVYTIHSDWLEIKPLAFKVALREPTQQLLEFGDVFKVQLFDDEKKLYKICEDPTTDPNYGNICNDRVYDLEEDAVVSQ